MKSLLTNAIVLTRTDFGEADRILTVLTPEYGKLRLMAKGVRKSTSKLAGGIELFSVSQLSYIPGKSDMGTLVSTRLVKYYEAIVKDIDRTMLGYDLLKRLNRVTEDAAEPDYYELLEGTFKGLNDPELAMELLQTWFTARLIKLGGHQPNLVTDTGGQKLQPDQVYAFDFEAMACAPRDKGRISANHIKLLRLLFGLDDVVALKQVRYEPGVLKTVQQLISGMAAQFLRT